ncbi:MAG: hypothetical protein HY081_08565, partial [Gammaproteobacteria bacterium]|nr:hypothetical protein [Gammaproteobacteria bacterium]
MTSWNITLAFAPRFKTKNSFASSNTFNALLIAGVLGGVAEILWVALYAQLSPVDATEVARQITASVIPAMADAAFAPWLGVAIHLVLSILLAFVFGALIWQPLTRQHAPKYTAAAAALFLIFVWTINFFVVLPRLNPVFVNLMPYSVTFFSKLLFGLAAGAWLY